MVQSSQTFSMHHDTASSRGSHAKQDTKRRDTANTTTTSALDMPSYNVVSSVVDGQQHWMAVTIIEDDDLMFGGKPLCTWYEEDRRCSMAEEGAPSPCSSTDDDEELHRGRQRDRPQYKRTDKHRKKSSYDGESDEDKKQH